MMTFKQLAVPVILAAAFLAAPVLADTKIGFVNTERLLREAPVSVAAQKKLEREFAGRDQELQKMAKQARDLQAQLDKDGVTMSDSERKSKETALANLNRELQRQGREFREDLNLRRNEELGVIQDKARKAIQDIAKAEKFDIIIEQAVYVDPKSDITDRVMKALGGK
ncbi:OmpH family outer membrane protein [Thiobacillus sedimenti]|uniref:OmpH family outer membrane protein n=1 Tax=Thiobacillus sedimenti TaxID=3110231 RepID=A0ABZ1CLZ7_9PROT|nr:OmpH family outer membrane protein [Thiobacillus sp. SCUT-2]WRS40070.1 OmpH family outer membrane protein [Thiobacillus sp. SCUT-2]